MERTIALTILTLLCCFVLNAGAAADAQQGSDDINMEELMGALGSDMDMISAAKTTADLLKATATYRADTLAIVKSNAIGSPVSQVKKDPEGARMTDLLVQTFSLIHRMEDIARQANGNLSDQQLKDISILMVALTDAEDFAHTVSAGFSYGIENGQFAFQPTVPEGFDALDPKVKKPVQELSPHFKTDTLKASDLPSGDRPQNSHDPIWHKEMLIAGLPGKKLPAPSEEVDVVFVGGGMGSLVGAYETMKKSTPGAPLNVLVLETGRRFGGNSQAENWHGIDYGTGAAYIDVPVPGSRHDQLLQELGLSSQLRTVKPMEEPVFLVRQVPFADPAGQASTVVKRYDQVWDNGTTAANKPQFNLLRDHFRNMAANTNGILFPQIPPPDEAHRKYIETLDPITFEDYLKRVAGGPLDPDLKTILDFYCKSALGGSTGKVSAAAGLNFFVGDSTGIAVLPGGNGRIADALFQRLTKMISPNQLRAESTVFDIRLSPDGKKTFVSYQGPDGQIRTVAAKSVVSTVPPFMLPRIIDNLETNRLEAIRKIKYKPYVVANILLKRKASDTQNAGYDLIFADTNAPASFNFNITDLVMGPASTTDQYRVLTAYIPGADGVDINSWVISRPDGILNEVRKSLDSKVLAQLGYSLADIEDIRLAMHAHAIPLASPGNMSRDTSGLSTVETALKPIGGRIFFAGQSVWGLPGWESTVETSYKVLEQTQAVIINDRQGSSREAVANRVQFGLRKGPVGSAQFVCADLLKSSRDVLGR